MHIDIEKLDKVISEFIALERSIDFFTTGKGRCEKLRKALEELIEKEIETLT